MSHKLGMEVSCLVVKTMGISLAHEFSYYVCEVEVVGTIMTWEKTYRVTQSV